MHKSTALGTLGDPLLTGRAVRTANGGQRRPEAPARSGCASSRRRRCPGSQAPGNHARKSA